MFHQFNFSAILVCAVLNMLLGFLWYAFIFTKPWMKLMGMSPDKMSDHEPQTAVTHGYFASFLSYIIMAIVLSYFVILTGATTALEGLKLGFLCWLGFSLTTMLPHHYFSMKPIKLAFINISYPLVGVSMMGVILAVWR